MLHVASAAGIPTGLVRPDQSTRRGDETADTRLRSMNDDLPGQCKSSCERQSCQLGFGLLSDREFWICTLEIARAYGDQSPRYAAMKLGAAALDGDAAGIAIGGQSRPGLRRWSTALVTAE